MNADIHTVFDGLDKVRRSKGAVYHGDHSWERLDQLTKGFKIKDRHCGGSQDSLHRESVGHIICLSVSILINLKAKTDSL